jgi:DUF4097 and DUF4098 domain-containing protein YvlB
VGAGDLNVSGAKGPVEINSGSGGISVEDSDASSVIIENKSGDVRLTRIAGNMNVRTASGDLTVERSSGKVVALESISGDVTVDLIEAVSGSLTVRTVNGDASIGIPDGSDARVTLATLRGNVSCGLELSDKVEAPQRITGKVGEGTGTIDISAVTGDVRLEMRKTEAAPV